eukprot:7384511-Prymnesium_polylepis.1
MPGLSCPMIRLPSRCAATRRSAMPSASLRWHSCSCQRNCGLLQQLHPATRRCESVVPMPRPRAPMQ